MEIVIFTVPLMGHLVPLIPIACELLQQGHTVTFFHEQSSKFRNKLVTSGAQQCQSVTYTCSNDDNSPQSWSNGLYETVLKYYSNRPKPDILVYDFFAVDAADAAEQLGIPAIGVFPNPLSINPWVADVETQNTRQWKFWCQSVIWIGEGILARLLWMIRSYKRWQRKLPILKEQDIYPTSYGMSKPMIGCYPPQLEELSKSTTAIPLYHMVGPSLPPVSETIDLDLQMWIDNQKSKNVPIVYIAFGTMYHHTSQSIQKMERELTKLKEDVAILWSLPRHQQAHLQSDASKRPNWKITSFLPQVSLMKSGCIDVFVTHCGSNSVSEAVLCGIPMICCPGFADQPANASRIVRAGLGVIANIKKNDKNNKSFSLSQAISEVLQTSHYKRNSQELAASISGQDNAKRAVEIIL